LDDRSRVWLAGANVHYRAGAVKDEHGGSGIYPVLLSKGQTDVGEHVGANHFCLTCQVFLEPVYDRLGPPTGQSGGGEELYDDRLT
jgi:hypothetical protein